MSAASTPGRLSVRLELQRQDETPDGSGGFASTWTAIGDIWAQVIPIGVSPVERAGNRFAEATHRIVVRAENAVSAGMRLRKGPRLFDIDAVFDPDETGRWLVCMSRERK